MPKIVTPRSVLIEKVALELAAVFYEIGRGQGLTSKWPNARQYAKANFEKFIPKATDLLLDMLSATSNVTHEMRQEIYEAMMERHDDPELNAVLPNINVKKLLQIIDEKEHNKVLTINTEPKTILHDIRKPDEKKQTAG